MKVFEVITEHMEGDSKEILTTREYVTSAEGTLQSVVNHFTEHCYQYGKELKSVQEVLTIVQHIEEMK